MRTGKSLKRIGAVSLFKNRYSVLPCRISRLLLSRTLYFSAVAHASSTHGLHSACATVRLLSRFSM